MPIYKVTDPKTGKTLRIKGDAPPNERDLDKLFGNQSAQPQDNGSTQGVGSAVGWLAKNLFYEPIKNTAVNTTKYLELLGAGLSGDLGRKERLERNQNPLISGLTYSQGEIEQKFGGESFGERSAKGGWETAKRAADVSSYFLPVDKWIASAGKKVAGPLANVSFRNISPGGLKKSVGIAKSGAGKVIEQGVKKATGKVSSEPVLNEMGKVMERAVNYKIPGATKAVETAMKRVSEEGAEMSVKKAHDIASGFWTEIIGEAGKTLTQRGKGKLVKEAKEIGAGKLSEGVKTALKKEGLTDAVQAFDTFHKLGVIEKSLEKPFKDWWIAAGVTGGMTSLLGVPYKEAAALSAVAGLLSTPYTKTLLRKSISSLISNPVSKPAGRVLTVKALNELLSKDKK